MGAQDTDAMEQAMSSREVAAGAVNNRKNPEGYLELAKIDATLAVAREMQEIRFQLQAMEAAFNRRVQ